MLKETTAIIETYLRAGESAETMNAEHVLAKFDALGSGGTQSTDQYVAMLVRLPAPPGMK